MSRKSIKQQRKAKLNAYKSEWYGIRSLLGHNYAFFNVILGAREAGKSYAVMKYFVKQWSNKHIPFYWLRLNEASSKKLLSHNAERFVPADIRRQYDLDLSVKGNIVYDHGKHMATILALSTFYSDKGVALFDKDFLNNPNMRYHICLDEFEKEKNEKSQGDICYQFVNQMENLVRSTKERIRIFLIGNTLEEASDILTMFNFIPEEFGRYKLKSKKCVIDYLPPTEKYKERRKGTIADILAHEQSTFTNEIKLDDSLITKQRLLRPTAIIQFTKTIKFTIWDDNVVAIWNNEKTNNTIAMRPYIDLMFNQKLRDQVIQLFDTRSFKYHNLITFKKFQKEIMMIKPRKQ